MTTGRSDAPSLFEWRRLTPHAWVVLGNGGNSVVVADGHDVLLVDTKELGFGAALRRDVERVIGRPVSCVVSTHHHSDHAHGNAAFTSDVPVIAHVGSRERTVARVRRGLRDAVVESIAGRDPFVAHEADLRDWAPYFGHVAVSDEVRGEYDALIAEARAADGVEAEMTALAERFAPTVTFDSEHALRIGDMCIELHHAGPGHTSNDLFVVVPGERLVIAADLVYVDLHPYVDAGGGGDTVSWQRSLDVLGAAVGPLAARGDVILVPGHGAPTDHREIARQRDYFDALRDTVHLAMRAGRSRAEIASLIPPRLPRDGVPLLAANLGHIHDELAGPR